MMEHEVVNSVSGELAKPTPAVLVAIGCGGGGSNAINRMIAEGVEHVDFMVINTDLQALNKSPAPVRIPIGQKITGGLGAGGNPEVGQKAAEEDRETLKNTLTGADMVFITAGMGGGTGTGSAPVVAEIAKELGCLTVGIVTTPFNFEGPARMNSALEGIERLRENVDSLIVIPNEQLLKNREDITMRDAFLLADDVLNQAIKGISGIINGSGIVNTDFADIKATMSGQGDALLGIGIGKGPNRASDAANNAINNPLLQDINIDGAKTLLINITARDSLKLSENTEIANIITASADAYHRVFWGFVEDPDMAEDEVSVTVIATGFSGNSVSSSDNENVEKRLNDNVYSSTEFDDLLNKDVATFVSPQKSSIFDSVQKEVNSSTDILDPQSISVVRAQIEKESHSLGDALADSYRTGGALSNGLNSNGGFVDQNDINQPACRRRRLSSSRGITLRED